MKIHFKTPGEKSYAYHPERILDDIFLLFTISPHWPQIINLKQFDQKRIAIDRCTHRKKQFIIHFYENPTYDDQTCTPRPRYVAGPEKDRQTKHPDLILP